MKYRSDIDGLRAIAVMSVILAHAGISAFAGGFLGVDIFFVVSGYLITTILQNELGGEKFSLGHFYERRARRILPALLVVIACSTPFAIWLMLPDFLENYGQSVVATLFFANNLLLALTSGYWELESAFKPMLHTWSLGVEEQFYVVFPLFLAAIWRYGRRVQIASLLLVTMGSLALAEHGLRAYPDMSFYLPSSRAWELMAGCLAAYVVRRPRTTDHAVSLISLAAVLAPMSVFNEHTPSPSVFSAIPVFGVVGLILFNRPETIAYRLLSSRPFVGVGLISYSAYLWHHPIFAFTRIANYETPGLPVMIGLIAVTLLLATASWRYVEQPFRDRTVMPMRRFLPAILGTSVLLIAVGLVLHLMQGFPSWTYPNIAKSGDVYISYNERIRGYAVDDFPANGRPNIVLIGDSYGRDIGNVLLESGAIDGKNLIYLATYPVCSEVDDYPDYAPAVLREADVVVVAIHQQDYRCLQRISAAIAVDTPAPIVFFGSKHFGANINPFGRIPITERDEAFSSMSDELVANNNQLAANLAPDRFIDVARLLGPDGKRVRFFDNDGNPLSPDRNHLTRYGAVFLAQRLRESQHSAWLVIKDVKARSKERGNRLGEGLPHDVAGIEGPS